MTHLNVMDGDGDAEHDEPGPVERKAVSCVGCGIMTVILLVNVYLVACGILLNIQWLGR